MKELDPKIKSLMALIKREQKIRTLIIEAKKNWIKYKFFIELIWAKPYYKANFSQFIKWNRWIGRKYLLKLEDYFGINKEK